MDDKLPMRHAADADPSKNSLSNKEACVEQAVDSPEVERADLQVAAGDRAFESSAPEKEGEDSPSDFGFNPHRPIGTASFEALGIEPPVSSDSNSDISEVDLRNGTMAAQGGGQRVVHQDYIVRQRYSNTLPPPPGAPKLLDLPNDGLNQYTMPLFASRMARAQPINIEADAFLGMPIDLVGMPGVFEGDESSIQAPLVQPPIDPKDRNMLRPLKSLGKPKGEDAEISFLRRTQYTAEDRSRIDAAKVSVTPNLKRRRVDGSKEDPMHILRDAIKAFDIANPQSAYTGPDTASKVRGHAPSGAELDAWNHPKHPTKPHLQPVDFYPVLPGMEAFPDDGMYTLVQFKGHPTDATKEYDKRMDAALLYPDMEDPQELSEELQAKLAAHKADPIHVLAPLPPMNFQFFLPEDSASAVNFQRKFDPNDPDRDDPSLYTGQQTADADEADCFRYVRIRDYETGLLVDSREDPYQEVAMVVHDGDESTQKGAYYYPVAAKYQLKPRRHVTVAPMGISARPEEPREKIDVVHVTVRPPNDDEVDMREGAKKKLEPEPDLDGE